MRGGDWCRVVIILASFIILVSLLAETRSLNSFWKALNNHASISKVADRTPTYAPKNRKGASIRINSNATIVSDISEIWHDPENQAICVSLKENARCPHPAFLGRLSGPALSLLEWKEHATSTNNEFIQCGSYKNQWLDSGTYFLDIITLFCEDFGINAMTRKLNESAWLSHDFQNDCMEDPNNNRITGSRSYVTIEKSLRSALPHQRFKGRWISNTTDPLHTRYQPRFCRRNPEKQERCAVPMNDTLHQLYSFEWESKVVDEWRERLKFATKTLRTLPKICLVGFSHSRFLKKSFGAIGLGNYVQHIEARYPYDVGEWLFNRYHTNHSCANFVVGVAQWPGSLMQGSPYLFDRYYMEMQRIATEAAKVFADKEDVKVYMRSVHQIPIGDVTGACPITDWRSPVVMDGYTHLIQKAVKEVQNQNSTQHVDFMDTRHIVSPMWDNAFDWIHLRPQVSDVEALYMAAVIYEDILNDPRLMLKGR